MQNSIYTKKNPKSNRIFLINTDKPNNNNNNNNAYNNYKKKVK